MKKYIFILIILLLSSSLKSNTHPKREVRAAWITTAYRLDWPQTLSISPETRKKQQKELIQLLDILKAANFNTVIFQVRGRGDANYRSKWEPSSMSLTGKTNIDPGYDALQFAIEESHKRGMECHAWLVAIPSGSIKTHQQLGKASPIHKEPKTFIKFKGGWYINPASPTAKDYLGRLVEDITSNYDVDGIHFDYLRYPDGAQKSFPDQKEFKKLGNGRTLDQWRRDNITEILSHSYHLVKSIKPWVKVSSSPIGKHSDTNRYSARGWNAYETVYQDVFKWLELGIQDQVYPMMYFRGNNYYPFALDWSEQSNGRQIISGLGIYFLDPREGNWTSEEIQRQLYFVRQNNLAGHAFFRAEFLVNDTQGVYTSLKNIYYKYPALIPPMPWLDQTTPQMPQNLTLKITDDSALLNWEINSQEDEEVSFVVYKSDSFPVDTSKPENILDIYVKGVQYIYTPANPMLKYSYFAVSTIDRFGNESQAIQLSPTLDIATLK